MEHAVVVLVGAAAVDEPQGEELDGRGRAHHEEVLFLFWVVWFWWEGRR